MRLRRAGQGPIFMLSIGHDGVVPDEPAIRQTGPGTREGSSVASGLSGNADLWSGLPWGI